MPPVQKYKYRTEWNDYGYALARAWPKGTLNVPAFTGARPFNELVIGMQKWATDLDEAAKRSPAGVNMLAMLLARYDQYVSQRMSGGPYDPRQRNPNLAWKLPVRRISAHYYQGWYLRKLGPGIYVVFNPTREAYYIEYGIHVSARRVRRPIRKLALLKTLKWADRAGVRGHVWEFIYGPLRGTGQSSARGRAIISTSIQSPGVMPDVNGAPGSASFRPAGGGYV